MRKINPTKDITLRPSKQPNRYIASLLGEDMWIVDKPSKKEDENTLKRMLAGLYIKKEYLEVSNG